MLPRDRFTIDPWFRHSSVLVEGGPEWQALADDLANGLKAWELAPTSHELTVKLYDISNAMPRRPKATKVLNAAQAQQTTFPRELACCLSFYGGSNLPQNRGRLYIPHVKMTNAAPGPRPTSTERTKVGDLVTLFAGLGGVNVDWIVWSPTKSAATKVEKWFVDDEWDIMRSRGDRPTTRTAGTTGG
jgi:hypothetical protein